MKIKMEIITERESIVYIRHNEYVADHENGVNIFSEKLLPLLPENIKNSAQSYFVDVDSKMQKYCSYQDLALRVVGFKENSQGLVDVIVSFYFSFGGNFNSSIDGYHILRFFRDKETLELHKIYFGHRCGHDCFCSDTVLSSSVGFSSYDFPFKRNLNDKQKERARKSFSLKNCFSFYRQKDFNSKSDSIIDLEEKIEHMVANSANNSEHVHNAYEQALYLARTAEYCNFIHGNATKDNISAFGAFNPEVIYGDIAFDFACFFVSLFDNDYDGEFLSFVSLNEDEKLIRGEVFSFLPENINYVSKRSLDGGVLLDRIFSWMVVIYVLMYNENKNYSKLGDILHVKVPIERS